MGHIGSSPSTETKVGRLLAEGHRPSLELEVAKLAQEPMTVACGFSPASRDVTKRLCRKSKALRKIKASTPAFSSPRIKRLAARLLLCWCEGGTQSLLPARSFPQFSGNTFKLSATFS